MLLSAAGVLTAGVVGAGLVETRVLPGRARLNEFLGLTGEDGAVPDVVPGERLTGSFVSAAMGGVETGWALSLPPGAGAAGLPVAVYLHGRDRDHRDAFDGIGLDRFLAAGAAEGVPPFAIASVDGGADGFWHARSGGDAEAMVFGELLPELAARGPAVERVALYGFSMGGYGALLLSAGHRDRVVAAVAASPALWRSFEEAQPGAYDDAADFERNDVFRLRDSLTGLPLRIDCGNDDPFAPNVAAFIDGLAAEPAGGLQPGLHTDGFLRRVAPEHIRFLGGALRS